MKNQFKENIANAVFKEAVDRYAEDIANHEPECDMTDEQIRVMEAQKDDIYKNVIKKVNKRKGNLCRRILIVAAVLIIILALALNTSALRLFLYRTYIDIKGNTMNVKTEQTIQEVPLKIENFMYKDEVVVPGWLPPELKLMKIRDFETQFSPYYESADNWLVIYAKANIDDDADKNVNIEQNVASTKDLEIMGEQGQIIEMHLESGDVNYVAVWNTTNIRYEITTNCELIVLEAMLDSLKPLK